MDRFDRIYQLHHLLNASRRPVPRQHIEQTLECSDRTAKRTIQAMRDYLHAPIEYDRERNGYYYDTRERPFELPGLWFNPSELQALLLMQQLLHQVEPGLLDPQLDPIRQRIDQMLKQAHPAGADIDQRIRLIATAARAPGRHFRELADATLARRPLHIRYHARGRGQASERDISPHRLTRYRDNWYLEAWCHLREGLRLFAIERIEPLGKAEVGFHPISHERLDKAFDQSYGIFTGAPRHTAVLAFTPERARWIEQEQWHPEQQARWRADGRYELRLPYADPTELILDILRYGPNVEVIDPPELRQAVIERLTEAIAIYQRTGDTD